MERRVAPNNLNTLAGGTHYYEVRLFYGGNDLIKFEDLNDPHYASAAYRCKFELVKGDDLDAPEVVAKDAEIPDASSKEKYRIHVDDNHALRSGGTQSVSQTYHDVTPFIGKPENYASEGWIRDVRPAVPLRVEIRKKSKDSDRELPFEDGEVSVVWRVADPAVDAAILDHAPFTPSSKVKDFMKEYYKRWKRVTDGSKQEDDNCSNQFFDVNGGENVRVRDFAIDPIQTLFKTPFDPGAPLRLVQVPDTTDKASSDAAGAVDANKKPIGKSEVVFRPETIGGDNYVFKLSLRDANGNAVKFKGPAGKEVSEFETGPFTMWRNVRFAVLATFAGVNQGYINWANVKEVYRPAFIEIKPPEANQTHTISEADWKTYLKDFFKNSANPRPTDAKIDDDTEYEFNKFFLPKYADEKKHLSPLTDFILRKACRKLDIRSPFTGDNLSAMVDPKTKWNPADDGAQEYQPGLCMMLARTYRQGSTLLGAYFYQRRFHMCTRGDATCTFAHELGHALYLGHSYTSFDTLFNNDASGAPKSVKFRMTMEEPENAQVEGHHQGTAVACLMSYENDYYGADGSTKLVPTPHATISGFTTKTPVEWFFCPVCLFKLRFVDVARQQRNDLYRDMVLRDLKPITVRMLSIATADGSQSLTDVIDISGTVKIPAAQNGVALAAFGKPESLANNSGKDFEKNISTMIGGEWIAEPNTIADFGLFAMNGTNFKGGLFRKAGQKGTVTIRFQIAGLQNKLKSKSYKFKFE